MPTKEATPKTRIVTAEQDPKNKDAYHVEVITQAGQKTHATILVAGNFQSAQQAYKAFFPEREHAF